MRQVGGFIREMEMAYDACRERGEKLLEDRLSFGQTIRMIFSGGHWEKDFQDQVESDVKTKVQAQIEHALTLLESDLRSIWQDLQERVSAQFRGRETDPCSDAWLPVATGGCAAAPPTDVAGANV